LGRLLFLIAVAALVAVGLSPVPEGAATHTKTYYRITAAHASNGTEDTEFLLGETVIFKVFVNPASPITLDPVVELRPANDPYFGATLYWVTDHGPTENVATHKEHTMEVTWQDGRAFCCPSYALPAPGRYAAVYTDTEGLFPPPYVVIDVGFAPNLNVTFFRVVNTPPAPYYNTPWFVQYTTNLSWSQRLEACVADVGTEPWTRAIDYAFTFRASPDRPGSGSPDHLAAAGSFTPAKARPCSLAFPGKGYAGWYVSHNWTVPADASNMSLRATSVRVAADPWGKIRETVESDNAWSLPFRAAVVIRPVELP
jgi:hypothetical protein